VGRPDASSFSTHLAMHSLQLPWPHFASEHRADSSFSSQQSEQVKKEAVHVRSAGIKTIGMV
jgi:hypothetical protein